MTHDPENGELPERMTFYEEAVDVPGLGDFREMLPGRIYFVPAAVSAPTVAEILAGTQFDVGRTARFRLLVGRSPITRDPFAAYELFPLVAAAERFVRRATAKARRRWSDHVSDAWDHLIHGACEHGDWWES